MDGDGHAGGLSVVHQERSQEQLVKVDYASASR